MLNIFNYQLNLNLNPYLLTLFIVLSVLYVIYIYKYTIPQTSGFMRVLLITTRSLMFAILLFLIFEPTFIVIDKKETKPVVPIFIDNSASMSNFDPSVNQNISEFLNKNISSNEIEYKLYSFDSGVKEIGMDSVKLLTYQTGLTNFENIFTNLSSSNEYITSAIIISDGIVNDGSSSIYKAENLNYPLFTIGIGDTAEISDIYINSILNNRFIYKETPTVIAAEISNDNFAGDNVSVSFLENNRRIETKEIELSASGINRVTFDYQPNTSGKQKLTIQVSRLENENNFENNIRSTFIDVLENKLNILVIGGSPSADFNSIYQSLNQVDEYNVDKYIQISENKFHGNNFSSKLDSAEVLVLVNFPFNNTPDPIIQSVTEKITKRRIPFFILIGADIKSLALTKIKDLLPFTQTRSFDEIFHAQPLFLETNFSLAFTEQMKNLTRREQPPIAYPNGGFNLKPGVEIISKVKVNNIATEFPMIVSQSNSLLRNITFIGSNFWKWRIKPETQNENFFDQLIYNSIQSLRVSNKQRRFFVETNKDIYAPGEVVEFIGELYDDKLEPINNAAISIVIKSQKGNLPVKLINDGNGIYKGEISIPSKGDFTFEAIAEVNGLTLNQTSGKFNIGEVDLEKLRTVMQINYLNMIASLTGGDYNYISDSKNQIEKIETLNRNKIKISTSSVTYDPLSLELFLIFLILLLSIEWFFRKKEGML